MEAPQAWNEALPIVYDDLKKIAAAHFRQEFNSHILQPSALAFMRLGSS